MDIQAHVPAVLCVLHNFMHRSESDGCFDPQDIIDVEEDWNVFADMEDVDEALHGHLMDGPTTAGERR